MWGWELETRIFQFASLIWELKGCHARLKVGMIRKVCGWREEVKVLGGAGNKRPWRQRDEENGNIDFQWPSACVFRINRLFLFLELTRMGSLLVNLEHLHRKREAERKRS